MRFSCLDAVFFGNPKYFAKLVLSCRTYFSWGNMGKLSGSDITLGEPLTFSLHDANGHLLLSKGYVITSRCAVDRLLKLNAVKGDVGNRGGGNTPSIDTSSRSKTPREPIENLSVFERVDGLTLNLKHTLISSLKTPELVDLQTRVKNFATKIQALCKEDIDATLASPYLDISNPYIVVHQIMGAILTEIIAERKGLSAVERLPFICAALTRDIGQLQIQSDLDKCNGPLPPSLKQAMREHPSRSGAILSAAGVTDIGWLGAVRMHHERIDGSGYPLGLPDASIALGAQILAIADTYSAMTKVRPYRTKAHNPTDALRNLYKTEDQGSALADTLIKGIGMMPPGSIVKLKNGEVAVVKSCILNSNKATVFSVYDKHGMPLFSPISRETKLPDFEIVGLVSLAECKAVAVMIRRLWMK